MKQIAIFKMITIFIEPLMRAKGLKPSASLLHKWGINRMMASRIIKGDISQIQFEVLEILCANLNCTPNDLLNYNPSNYPLASHCLLHSITKTNLHTINPINAIQQLGPAELYALNTYIENTFGTKKNNEQ
jgi:DNA-binding Xre family transcriptional regulator